MSKKIKCILTIAGSDSSAGAGIQSDLKTFKNHGLYGLTVVTTITAQNTKGVQQSFPLRNFVVTAQLESILSDFKFNVAKTGVLENDSIIKAVSLILKRQKNLKLVADPVLMSKNKYFLINNSGLASMKKYLMNITFLFTPNLFEAQYISGMNIYSPETLEQAIKKLYSFGCRNVLVKGGHFGKKLGIEKGIDILYNGNKFYFFKAPFIKSKNTHGIGCTFSAAIASNLALGFDLISSISKAKKYVIALLQKNIKIGSGIGPVEV
jgi:hydroxymethylpyrimidine/phosphomethylpyrimidine kinase